MPSMLATDGSRPPLAAVIPTGIPHVDRFVGGQRPGDCNGLLAADGPAANMQLVGLAVQNAKNFYRIGNENGTAPKLSVVVSYQLPASTIESRILGNACLIPCPRLRRLTDRSQLTTQASLAAYERTLPEAMVDGVVLSESQRLDRALMFLRPCLRVLDMSGMERFPHAGTGYVDEIAVYLETLRETTKSQIGAVQIADAETLCRRQKSSRRIGNARLRSLLNSVAEQLRQKIAVPFECSVWLEHRLAGSQNRRPAATLLHHCHAKLAEGFADQMAACGVFGTHDLNTRCLQLHWSQVRYWLSEGLRPPILKTDLEFWRLVDVSSRYVLDARSHEFVARNGAAGRVGDPMENHIRFVDERPVRLPATPGRRGRLLTMGDDTFQRTQ